jgi:hypothetical protein
MSTIAFRPRPWPRDPSGRPLMVSELDALEFRLQVASATQEMVRQMSPDQRATLMASAALQRSVRASAIGLMLARNANYAARRALRYPKT